MKNIIKTLFIGSVVLCGFFINLPEIYGQEMTKAELQNQRIGRGINLGNALEAPNPGDWGVNLKEEYFELIAEQGFNSLRVPIRWNAHAGTSPPYTIHESFFELVDWVIDNSLKNGLYTIINFHHYEALFDDPDAEKERFLALWTQVCHRYGDYSDSLIFEILNEPHGNLTISKWNSLLDEAYSTIRSLQPDRTLIVGPADWGGVSALNQLQIPADDDNIILTIHYYNPFQFTHQEASWSEGSDAWAGTPWKNTLEARQAVIDDITGVINYSETHDIPVYMGEFGAYSAADMQSRVRWTNFIARIFEEYGFSWAYWEFCSGFGIYNDPPGTWNEGLVYALLHMPMSNPNNDTITALPGNLITNPHFLDSTNHWYLYQSPDAEADFSVENNKAKVAIQDGTANAQDVALVNNGLRLEYGKSYKVSFLASASESRLVEADIVKGADPWVMTSYCGKQEFAVNNSIAEYAFYFTMNQPTDVNARFRLNLGASNVDVFIDNVAVEDLSYVSDTSLHQLTLSILDKASGEPVAGADVIINEKNAVTNADGTVVFQDMPVGYHEVKIAKQHYDTLVRSNIAVYEDVAYSLDMAKTSYSGTVEVVDMATGEPLSGAGVIFGSETKQTGLSGQVVFSLPQNAYSFSVTKTDYSSVTDSVVHIESDSVITVSLIKTHGEARFYTYSDGIPIKETAVVLGSDTIMTTSLGLARFQSVPLNETYPFSVEKYGYAPVEGTFLFRADTAFEFNLEKTLVDMRFTVLSNDVPVENAAVVIDADTSMTNANGLAGFYDYPKNVPYAYSITGGGVIETSGIVTPTTDTSIVVSVLLSDVHTFANETMVLYPNPVKANLHVQSAKEIASLRVFSLFGNMVLEHKPDAFEAVLDMNGLSNGQYIIQIRYTDGSAATKKVVYSP
ncbi:MAG: cellulase family glycosylhydrolase [Bacteroidota bacterium]